jgi:alcohol dehydrogenase
MSLTKKVSANVYDGMLEKKYIDGGQRLTYSVFSCCCLCATAGAKLRGATTIITVESVPRRMEMSRQLGANFVIDHHKTDPVEEIMRITKGRGVDVAIEALGLQLTFENCLRALKPGGTLSSLGVYSENLTIPLDAFHAGLGDNKIITSLCPGGKERMRRLMNVVAAERIDLKPLITHHYLLDQIEDAYELFANQRDGVLKVAIKP